MDRLICLNNALWSVNSMLNSEDPTQWYSTVVRIEKVGFPWACLNSFTNIISCWPDLTGCLHAHGNPLFQYKGDRSLLYEPEIFPALNFKIEGVNFCCFHTGKVVITGIKTTTQIHDAVYPTLIELELYVREKWSKVVRIAVCRITQKDERYRNQYEGKLSLS